MADTDLAKKEQQKIETVSVDTSSFASYLDTAKFNQLYRVANVFAASDIVPEHYRGKPANCFLALQMATRLEIEPMMFIQNSYIVHGKPGLQAVVSIALVNSRGPFKGPIQWEFEGSGNSRKCTAYATHKLTNEVCKATVTWAMVEAEGWNKDKPIKTGGVQKSKWNTMPDQMFQYRSASFLAKLYCPEVILGLPTAEELEDIESAPEYKPVEKVSSLDEKLTRKKVESVQKDPEEEILDAKAADEQAGIVETAPESPVTVQDAPQTAKEQKPYRFYCNRCSAEFETPKGTAKKLCPKCLSDDIVDREKQ